MYISTTMKYFEVGGVGNWELERVVSYILYRAFFCWSSEWEEWKQKAGLVVAVLTLLLLLLFIFG